MTRLSELRRLARAESGAAAIEFAFVLPVLDRAEASRGREPAEEAALAVDDEPEVSWGPGRS